MAMTVAILCGGHATRMGDLTKDKPKSLLKVAGKPFIFWQLDLIRNATIHDVVLCVGYLGDQIEKCVGDGKHYGLNIKYSYDDHLGTGGAIKKALPLLGNEFMVIYGDSYLRCNYEWVEERFRHCGKQALITLYNSWPYGLGVFKASAFDGFEGKFDLNEVYEALALRNDLAAAHMTSRWYEIGSPKGYAELCRHLQKSS
jgi:MurNAc alpha-1-phosphate uridylyltransferase